MIDRASRDNLFGRLSLGELSPAEAEAEAARLGLEPLAPTPDDDTFDPAKEAHWTLPMAVAWIAYRTWPAVRLRWETYRKELWDWHQRESRIGFEGETQKGWFLEQRGRTTLASLSFAEALAPKTDRDPRHSMTVADARKALWDALQSDCFRVTGVDQRSGERVEILPTTWIDLRYFEQNGVDEVRRDPLLSNAPHRYQDVLLPSRAIRGLWREPFGTDIERLPPNVLPIGDGYMPLYCAAQWIATEGGAQDFEPRSPAIWKTAYEALLASIASEEVKVVGTGGGERELVPGFHFADCQVEYPFPGPSTELIVSETLYLRSYPYLDDAHWRGGFDDALINRRGTRWSRLMVSKSDVRRLWPFAAAAPAKTGAPGRPTSMHLIADELERRAAEGRMSIGVSQEASELLAWLVETHPTSTRPTLKTIQNNIRSRYRELRNTPK